MLVVPTSCDKSFLLNPLELISKLSVNPGTERYAWVFLGEYEVAYLYGLRWSTKLIA